MEYASALWNAKFMLNAKKKQQIINKFKTHANDTGSTEVQIAILTEEIKELTKHLQSHKNDHSLAELAQKVGEKTSFDALQEVENNESYQKLITELKLKPTNRLKREEEVKKILEAGIDGEGTN